MFTTISATAFAAMFAIWRNDGYLNITIKLALLALAIWGGIEAMVAWGFVLAPLSN